MSSINNRADSVAWATAASTVTGETGGEFRFAVGTTCLSASIPVASDGDPLVGHYIRLAASGSNMDVAVGWGTTGPALVYGQCGTVDSLGYITSSAASGGTVFASTAEHFMLPVRGNRTGQRLWLSVIAETSGTVSFHVSEGKI